MIDTVAEKAVNTPRARTHVWINHQRRMREEMGQLARDLFSLVSSLRHEQGMRTGTYVDQLHMGDQTLFSATGTDLVTTVTVGPLLEPLRAPAMSLVMMFLEARDAAFSAEPIDTKVVGSIGIVKAKPDQHKIHARNAAISDLLKGLLSLLQNLKSYQAIKDANLVYRVTVQNQVVIEVKGTNYEVTESFGLVFGMLEASLRNLASLLLIGADIPEYEDEIVEPAKTAAAS